MISLFSNICLVFLVVFLCKYGDGVPMDRQGPIIDPTPGPKGVECDMKMNREALGQNGTSIRKCYRDYFVDGEPIILDARKVIDRILGDQNDNQAKCCFIWNLVKCLQPFYGKYCDKIGLGQWNDFIKRRTQYLEMGRCKHTRRDDPVCSNLDIVED